MASRCGSPGDEHDVVAVLEQAAADDAADGAGTDEDDAHVRRRPTAGGAPWPPSPASSTMRAATGDSVRSRRHTRQIWRGGTSGDRNRTSTPLSRVSTASSGMTAQPMPARTIAIWAPLSYVRNTNVGLAPTARRPFSMSSWQLLGG